MQGLTTKQRLQVLEVADALQKTIIPNCGDVAFITLMRICRDYVDQSRYPAVKDRESWLIERLNKYRIRFFEKI